MIPLKKLTYSWKGGPSNEITTLDTIVEWTLKEQGNGTILHLRHSGFKDENYAILTGMTDGWLKNIEKMLNYLNENNNGNAHS